MASPSAGHRTSPISACDTRPIFLTFSTPIQNVTSSSTVVAALEAARDLKAPIILQVSQGGAAFFGGKGLKNDQQQGSIAGAVAAAHYIRSIAPAYGV